MTNLWAASLRFVLVLKRIEIFKSSSCIIRDRSHWGILKIQDIPNIIKILIKMTYFPELNISGDNRPYDLRRNSD